MRWKVALFTIMTLAAAGTTESHALAVMFTDRTAWQTAVDLAGLQREAVDLSGIPDGTITSFPLPFGETMLTNPSGDIKAGSEILHTTPSTVNTFDPAPFTGAFGFEMQPLNVPVTTMSLELDDGSTVSSVVTAGTFAFFGWIGGSTTTILFGCTTGICEDFLYAAMEKGEALSAVPEPGTVALMSTAAIAALAWLTARKRTL
jgi:hypothetical protein